MILALFLLSLAVALGVSYGIARLCRDVAEGVLRRFLSKNAGILTAKYLQFVIVVVGVSSGTRLRLLEDYIGAPTWSRPDLAAQLTPEVWALALYHTLIESLQGILWLLLIFALLFVTAVMVMRRMNMTWLLSEGGSGKVGEAKEPVVPIR